jgi:3-oxoacyl-[acyl-carrier protein] reductase
MVEIDLSGKVALITGASRGIGRAAARLYATAGARVVITHSRSADEAAAVVKELGPETCMAVQADIADPEAVRRMIEDTVQRFGRLDILVNNAATFRENLIQSEDYDAWRAGWQRTFDVNLFGAANAVFLAVPHMKKNGGGKVINVASRAAHRGETEFADYGASKAALVNLTKSIARTCGPDNITATCIAPGFIETEMAASELEKHRQEIISQIPLGRVGSESDVAGVLLFLASPFADYLNGATIDINGGSYVR